MSVNFLRKLFFFLVPLISIIFLITASSLYLGDALPNSWLINNQIHSDSYIVTQPWHSQAQYKLSLALAQDPDIMVFGSSRMNFFRSAFANNDPSRFYNISVEGGRAGLSLALLQELIAHDVRPEVIIVGLDFPKFSTGRGQRRLHIRAAEYTLMDNLIQIYAGIRRTSLYWLTQPSDMFNFMQIRTQDDLVLQGLNTFLTERGLLSDGSHIRISIEERDSEQWERERQSFEARTDQFATGDVDQIAMDLTGELLEFAEANDITVIGILPAFSPYWFDIIDDHSDYAYRRQVIDELETLFANYGMPFYDLTDPRILGGSEAEMLDVWHPADLLSLRMFHYLVLQEPDLLAEFSDADVLAGWIQERELQNDPLAMFFALIRH